jgi:hypothetical protein
MKKILTIILLLIFASTLTACPETETVYGWALGRSGDVFYGLKGVRIHLAADGFAGADAVTNTFGYYAIENVPECNAYTVTAAHRKYTFTEPVQQFVFPIPDAEGEGIEIDFVAESY